MNNKQPSITVVYDRKKKSGINTKAPLELRIAYNYQQKFLSTGIMLLPNQWKKGCIINCPDIIQLSESLNALVSNVRQILMDMMKEGSTDLNAIPSKLKALQKKNISFLEFCQERMPVRKYGKLSITQKRYDRFFRLFTKWGKIQQFKDLTEKNIIDYDSYLKSTRMSACSRWTNYHRFLNSFILDAIDAGYLRKNPYKWIHIDKDKTVNSLGRHLTPEEFEVFKTFSFDTNYLERVRDIFVFQTYTCMSYSDLVDFDSNSIEEVKGMKVYAGNRNKTGKPFTIPLLPIALEILKKYDGKLPIISNVNYNKYLKEAAVKAGIKKHLCTHWARHTGATLLLNEGIDMKIVSRICGHSSTRITEQVYAKLLDETVVDAVANLSTNS